MGAEGPERPWQPKLDLEDDRDGGTEAVRLVEVAVDAPGPAGARAYTYHLPPSLGDVQPGEAVLVEFARRQALGIVLRDAEAAPGIVTKPIRDRVRADGPLLPELTLRLARWAADYYLAPPAATIRSLLPPGMLERLELVVEAKPTILGTPGADAAIIEAAVFDAGPVGDAVPGSDAAIVEALAGGPRPVRELPAPDGRPALLRRLKALAATGAVALDWTLISATSGPRYERWLLPTLAGRTAAAELRRGERPSGRPLGARQVAALLELVAASEGALPPGDTPGSEEAGPPGSDGVAPPGSDGATSPLPALGLASPGLAARHGSAALAGLVRRGLVEVEVRERERRPLGSRPAGRRGARPPDTDLTPMQAEAVDAIRGSIEARDPRPIVLDGVTGGGKTAVYVEAIAASLEIGRPALVLVPEIALAVPLVDRLRADLSAEVALLHSSLGAGERADEWRRIRAGGAEVVVGTRMAVLAPLADVGLIVVDEEHDPAYKSDRTPRIQARDTAVRLAELAGASIVLGSATPAVDTVWHARAGTWRRFRLPTRPSGAPPIVELVDLRAELAAGNRGLLSARLAGALGALQPARGERAILVINRRGTASVVLCRDCGHVQACPECGRPLVFHQAGYTLRCHHCGTAAPLATRCPACRSPRIRYLGGGTERVEREVRETFPALRVGRLDRDVVERRGAAERIVDAFTDGRLDVLVGTSLVTKGLDIPEVTLVGIVSADVALNLPDERAAERTYQLLAQAVGRAGRGEQPGSAIVQTYQPAHPAIQAVVRVEGDAFYDAELELRRRFGSPPFGRLVKLTVALPDRAEAEAAALERAGALRAASVDRAIPVTVVGPAPAFIARRAGRWRFNVVLRGPEPARLLEGGVDPPWSVDVDPESLL